MPQLDLDHEALAVIADAIGRFDYADATSEKARERVRDLISEAIANDDLSKLRSRQDVSSAEEIATGGYLVTDDVGATFEGDYIAVLDWLRRGLAEGDKDCVTCANSFETRAYPCDECGALDVEA